MGAATGVVMGAAMGVAVVAGMAVVEVVAGMAVVEGTVVVEVVGGMAVVAEVEGTVVVAEVEVTVGARAATGSGTPPATGRAARQRKGRPGRGRASSLQPCSRPPGHPSDRRHRHTEKLTFIIYLFNKSVSMRDGRVWACSRQIHSRCRLCYWSSSASLLSLLNSFDYSCPHLQWSPWPSQDQFSKS
jgi:hypothetical protein